MKDSNLEQKLQASKPDTSHWAAFTTKTIDAIRKAQADETFSQAIRTTNANKQEHLFMKLHKKLTIHKYPKLTYISMFGVLLIAIVAISAATLTSQHKHTGATPSVTPGIGAAVPSQFKFSGAIGWWQGATNETSVAVFHGANEDSCFVSVQHNAGSVSIDEAKVASNNSTLHGQGYTVTPYATKSLTFQTSEGAKQYELYQSSVTTPAGADFVEGGQEFAYIPLTNGHIYIESYCNTPSELSATIPVLQAFTLDENK